MMRAITEAWADRAYQTMISPVIDRIGVAGVGAAVLPEASRMAGLESQPVLTLTEWAAVLGIAVSVMWVIKLALDIYCKWHRFWYFDRHGAAKGAADE